MGIKYLRNHIDILTFLLFPENLGVKYQFQSVIQERLRQQKVAVTPHSGRINCLRFTNSNLYIWNLYVGAQKCYFQLFS